ncbi:Uncharacterized membrane protein YfhO [Ruminococcus sp. YE71]|uniref:YfhO family protein n=1 Tax=unclassified Ruminococcus TaxID=2608920 RepID=UPI0008882FCC|nr:MULTISPECIES: YfhO family protein [unclassified Ruminococcus]SDA14515.1 Uncharacterized membrane protein YfhO [Ruminococcus sp. YE78]SFW21137.1 Uncharacterized membrane protein YfhO [Ruminococcus sp. YE71]
MDRERKTFSKKWHRFCDKLRRPFFLYLLCFLLPVGIMYLAYALFGVHPYGDGSVLVLDLNGQYVYYYEAYRDAFLGDGSLIYDWSRNLSGSMFGIFAYYLASPFMILVCLFPRTAMCGAIETIQLMKIGSAAVTFAYFMRKTFVKLPKKTTTVVFSMCYALMSYMVVQLMDPMWLDGLIYLPLICLGVKRLLNEGKMLPYIVPLALMFIAHFYIGYMVGFFTFCYFVYCFFGEDGRIVPKRSIIRILQFGGATLTAIMAASCVLLPVYNSLKLGKLEFSTPDWSMATQFDFMTFLTKLFPMSYDTVYPEGLPVICCGAAVLMLVPLYFMNSKISVKKKAANGILTVLMVVFMYLRPVDIVWHGFQVPNWLPFRYSFAFSFLLVVMAAEAFEALDGITPKEIGGVFVGLMMFLFWCERENYAHFEIFRTVTEEGKSKAVIGGIWFSMIALAVYFLIIYLNRKYTKIILSIITVSCFGLEMLANTMDTLQKIDDDVSYSSYVSYEPYMQNTINAVKHIKNFDEDKYYRMEATFHRTVNDPIGTNYMGISHSSSVMNAPALKMLKQLGYAYGGHYTKYEGTTLITDSIFDIRYLMYKEEQLKQKNSSGVVELKPTKRYNDSRTKVPEDYKLATHIGFEDDRVKALYKFYRNPYSTSLGMVTDSRINQLVLSDADPFSNQNQIYSVLAGEDTIRSYFTRIMPKDSERLNMSTARVADEEHTIKYYPTDPNQGESHIDYLIEMDRDGDLYMYFPTRYERNCNVWVLNEEAYINGDGKMDFAGQFFGGDNLSILKLGNFAKNETVRVRVTIDNDQNEAYWSDSIFCSFDHELFEKSAEKIQQRLMNVTEFGNTKVSGECTADNDGEYLFTTIPDEPGWVVKVNGKRVITDKSLGSLISIPLDKGKNKIEMSFEPTYYTLGKVISAAGVVVIIIIFLLEFRNGRLITDLVLNAERRKRAAAAAKKAEETENSDENV